MWSQPSGSRGVSNAPGAAGHTIVAAPWKPPFSGRLSSLLEQRQVRLSTESSAHERWIALPTVVALFDGSKVLARRRRRGSRLFYWHKGRAWQTLAPNVMVFCISDFCRGNHEMANLRNGVVAAAIGLQLFGILAAEAASRPSALAASYSGILLDGPLAGQVAGAGAVPFGATRHIKTPYGVVVCEGGNNRLDLETNKFPRGNQKRSCQW